VRISIVIPAYNEEETVGEVLSQIDCLDWTSLAVEHEVIVVDDGSTDRTAEVVGRFPRVRLIRHPTNQGKGSAVRTALSRATGDVILIQDADLEYPPSNYSNLLAPIVRGEARVVYGSRFKTRWYPVGMRPVNFLANRFGTWLQNRLYGIYTSDAATGHKVFHRDILRQLALRAEGFELCAELNAGTGRLRVPIWEVPIPYRARSFREGKKFRWHHGVKILREIFRFRSSKSGMERRIAAFHRVRPHDR
jgi:glycosyltransferase involved in cell wall biosynthesis